MDSPNECTEFDRYDVDGETVIDHLTGLQWERKDSLDDVANSSDPHDADNLYTLLAGSGSGTAYTSFLRTLNDDCFAGWCDWRLPTLGELQAISPPCDASPCIDPQFGPTFAGAYWSPLGFLDVSNGAIGFADGTGTAHVRAVRRRNF